ncbi:hypothetical protein P7K49_035072 [Saguinus oedipus]|uniref:Uncharacterized protein n=1 Tax=Saguinus oedipus TaxID=9490 RepID=A0ABQ9TWJ7_SAGOE|nr:hypothetical protein P7K49_035072 [Saguinus oedipus]
MVTWTVSSITLKGIAPQGQDPQVQTYFVQWARAGIPENSKSMQDARITTERLKAKPRSTFTVWARCDSADTVHRRVGNEEREEGEKGENIQVVERNKALSSI